MATRSWSTEGEFADDNYTDLIFTNPAIESFLSGNSQFIIVASKGMGKTLLMRLKRDRVHATNPSIILIPQHGQQSDFVLLTGSYEQGILNLMGTAEFWEHIWTISIQVSVLLNFPHKLTADEKKAAHNDLKRVADFLPVELSDDLEAAFTGRYRAYRPPSGILSLLLSNGRSKFERLRLSAPQVLHDLMRHVTSGCFVFIDSFDLAIGHFKRVDLNMWAAAQRGLLRAAWDISRHNHHVKVYVTIRQEAYASFDGDESINMKGSVLLLSYSKDDLRALLVKSIAHYEGLVTLEEFLGLNTVFNEYLQRNEEPFDYMHRHSIDVPRWFAVLGKHLSQERNTQKYKNAPGEAFREIINRVSADLAEEYLIKEMKLFFRDVDPKDMVQALFSRTRTTVLSFANVDYLAHLFTDGFGWKHPFSLFYNLGLLGFVQQAPASPGRMQHFKRPYQFDWSMNNILPEDKDGLYLMHPALHALMKRKNTRCEYCPVLIGDGLPWTKEEDKIVRRETVKVFISYAHEDETLVEEIVLCIQEEFEQRVALFDIWFDKWRMEAGRPVHDQVEEALQKSDYLVLMVSENSLNSKFVELEWKNKYFDSLYDRTKSHDKVLPVHLTAGPSKLPDFIVPLYAFSYTGPKDKPNLNRLVDQMLRVHRSTHAAGQH
jgi:hypothetical protein